jgi:hypothetical protein
VVDFNFSTNDIAVNTTTTGEASSAIAVPMGNGGFLTLWQTTDGRDSEIFGQRFSDNGEKQGFEFQLNEFSEDGQTEPTAALLDSGSILAMWDSDPWRSTVKGRELDANGRPVGTEFDISNSGHWNVNIPADGLAQSNGGNILALFDDTDESVKFALLDQNFTVINQADVFTGSRWSDKLANDVTSLNDGNFVAAWESEAGNEWDVYARIIAPDGGFVSDRIRLNNFTANDQTDADLTPTSDGGFLAVWESEDQDGDGGGIVGQRFDSGGQKVGFEFSVPQSSRGDQEDPSVLSVSDNAFLVTWESSINEGDSNVYGRFIDGDGNGLTDEFVINDQTARDQFDAHAFSLSEDRAVVTFLAEGEPEGRGFRQDVPHNVFARMIEIGETADPNDPPTATDDTAQTSAASPVTISVLSNDSDPDGDTLTLETIVQSPSNGNATIGANGQITYTPFSDFTGSDSFTYRVSDGNTGTDTAQVTVTISDGNGGPNPQDDSGSVQAGTSTTIAVLSNDTDPDGDTLTLTSIVQGPSNGSTFIADNNQISYTPATGFAGQDTFTYRVSDGQATADATVTVQVGLGGAVIANPDTAETETGQPVTIDVLSNDTDETGSPLTLEFISDTPSNGSATIQGSEVVYTPNTGFTGSDSFSYRVSNFNDDTDTGLVQVSVIGPEPPAEQGLQVATGWFDQGSSFAEAIEGPSDAAWFKIFDAQGGGFITEGASRIAGGDWVSAGSLAQMSLSEGRFFVKSWGPQSRQTDWQSGNVTLGRDDSFVEMSGRPLPPGQEVSLGSIIDSENLTDESFVRVFVPGQEDFGFLSASDLSGASPLSITTGSVGSSTNVWVDLFLSGQGRSGWSRTEFDVEQGVSAASVDPVVMTGLAEDDTSSLGIG